MVGGYYVCAPTTSTENLPIFPAFFAPQQSPKSSSIPPFQTGLAQSGKKAGASITPAPAIIA
jgi:hypothetical protein|tara:strand:- start:615 stop:800 length:186 start_codon:yes stop_codon:yes gene_type:complete